MAILLNWTEQKGKENFIKKHGLSKDSIWDVNYTYHTAVTSKILFYKLVLKYLSKFNKTVCIYAQ